MDNNQPPTSRTATPMRKTSISSIDLPPDPNTLLTTTDEPDPDDPSVINSTVHFQMRSSQPPNSETFLPNRDEPSPLMNIVPVQEFPSRIQSVELPSELLPTEEQFHRPSSIIHHSPTNEIELEPNDEVPPMSPESEVRLPSTAPSDHEQEHSPHRTPSLSRHEHQQQSAHQSPSLPYPARLEDLMRPTPSPFHSAHEYKQEENEEAEHNRNERLLSVSPPINETETHHRHHPIHQNIPSQFDHNDIRSPSNSPRRSKLPNSNHTSVEGDETNRQQLDSPSISPQNDIAISPDHDDPIDYVNNTNTFDDISNHYQAPLQRIEPAFITEHQQRPFSEKSASPTLFDHHEEHEKNLHRNDAQLSSASIKPIKHHFSPPSSPARPSSQERELPTMTASQQHSKLSLRLKQQEPKRKKSIHNERTPPSLSTPPQIDVGTPHERQITAHRIDHLISI